MITRALGLVVTISTVCSLVACGPQPDEAELAGLEAEAAALTPSPPPPPITWELHSAADGVINIATCHNKIYRLLTGGRIQSAAALGTSAPVWQDEAIAPDATATAITCNELDRIPPLFWPELYVTRAGQLYFYNGAWHRLSPDVRGSIDYKVFGPYQHWLFNKVGGYLGQWTDTTPVTWTLRNPMQEAKLTAVDLGYGSDRYVFAINRDNSLWVSLDAAATFRRTADSVDSLLIGAYSVDLEAMFSHDVIATDYGGTVERPRVYLFALFKGPYGTYIYRGTIRP